MPKQKTEEQLELEHYRETGEIYYDIVDEEFMDFSNVDETDAISNALKIFKKFDPSQPRDDDGKWTNDSGDEIPDENKGVFFWTKGSKEVSDYLRLGSEEAGLIDSEFPGGVEAQIENMDNFLTKNPKKEGSYFRGLTFDSKEEYDNFFKEASANSMFIDKSYMATSRSKKVIKQFTSDNSYFWAEITVNGKGVDISTVSANPSEGEVLFPRNSKFKIVSIENNTHPNGDLGTWATIKLEQIKDAISKALKFNPNQARDDDGKWTDEGNQNEKDSVTEWTADNFAISSYLREGVQDAGIGEEMTKGLDVQIENMDNYLAKEPKVKGVFYRGLKFNDGEAYDNFFDEFSNNKIFMDRSFLSATSDQGVIHKFSSENAKFYASITIEGKGVDVSDISLNPKEKEVLFPRNSKFKVVSISNHLNPNEIGASWAKIKLKQL